MTVDMAGQSASGVATADGEFKVCLPNPLPVGGPYEAVVTTSGSEDSAVLRNVMSGDVVLCSGQSNMQHRTDATFEFEENGVDDIEYVSFFLPTYLPLLLPSFLPSYPSFLTFLA